MKTKKRGNVYWIEDECELLKSLIEDSNYPVNWEYVTNGVNYVYKNKRTPKACERKYAYLKPNAFDRRWSKDEVFFLVDKTRGIIASKVNWDKLCISLNKKFKKSRSPTACKQKWYECFYTTHTRNITTGTFKPSGGYYTTSNIFK